MTVEEFKWANYYFNFLDFKSKGLRQKALECMREFIKVFTEQSKSERRKFINAVNIEAFKNGSFNNFMPHNLYQIFVDEIQKWQNEEPNNPIAFKWTHDHIDLMKSISLDPNDQVTLEMLSSNIINKIGMNQHELDAGFGYQGNPKEDIDLIKFLNPHLENLIDQENKNRLKGILKELEESAERHL